MRRRTFLAASTGLGTGIALSGPPAARAAAISATLTARDPQASPNARSLYTYLTGLENAARAGSSLRTILGQHVEGQNAPTASPWVIWNIWGDGLTSHNSNADVKATYYDTGQVCTGGSGTGFGQNVDWGSVHAH